MSLVPFARRRSIVELFSWDGPALREPSLWHERLRSAESGARPRTSATDRGREGCSNLVPDEGHDFIDLQNLRLPSNLRQMSFESGVSSLVGLSAMG